MASEVAAGFSLAAHCTRESALKITLTLLYIKRGGTPVKSVKSTEANQLIYNEVSSDNLIRAACCHCVQCSCEEIS